MHLHEHYLHLRTCLSDLPEREPSTVTLQAIAEHLCCTERHASLILKQMAQADWLRWQPGRGRGHRSQLTFLIPREEVALLAAQEEFLNGDAQTALQQIESLSAPMQSQFMSWIAGQFGHAVEASANGGELDILRIPFSRLEIRFDPGRIRTNSDAHLIGQVFDTLVTYDPQPRTLRPHLAHAWEISEDGTVYTFYLRKGVLFHHGRLLTAHDARTTLERLLDPQTGSSLRPFLPIRGMRVVREYVLEVTLTESDHFFLHALSRKEASIVPCEVVRELEEQFDHFPVGTGPYQVVKKDGAKLVLQAFDRYFLGRPHLDRVEFWFGMEGEHVQDSGLEHARTNTAWPQIAGGLASTSLLLCNAAKEGPLQKGAWRESLHAALDRKRMVEELGGRREAVAVGFLPENHGGASAATQHDRTDHTDHIDRSACAPRSDSDGCPSVKHPLSSDQATTITQVAWEADAPSPPPLFPNREPLRLHTFDWPENLEDAAWIRERCAEAGIPVEVRVFPIHEFAAHQDEADLLLVSWQLAEDIEFSLFNFYQPGRVTQRFLPTELQEEFAGQVQALKREANRDKRFARLQGLEALLRDEHLFLFLYHYRLRSSYNPALGGVTLGTLAMIDYRHLWFKRSPS
ncbi:MAG TPA: ABC transporter substrate-binding protein [Bacilli bacterium]|nr:ABC transporter substrate-binding protein [Bacilli bacterium]